MAKQMERFFDDNDERIQEFVRKFTGYSLDIDATKIRNWIRQFDENDYNLALKILDHVEYYNHSQIIREMRELHLNLTAILQDFDINTSYFMPFCQPGHSGEFIVDRFRLANKYKAANLNDRFIHLSNLNLKYDEPEARLFFIEDFIGTGDSTFKIWEKISDIHQDDLYLLVITGHQEGINRIESELPITVICNRVIHNNSKWFSNSNTFFSANEKHKIREYCNNAGSQPEGYNECQSNVVFFYRAPNDIISILRCNNSNWKGLFIRNI